MNFSHLLKMYEVPIRSFPFPVTRSHFARANRPRIANTFVFIRFMPPPFRAQSPPRVGKMHNFAFAKLSDCPIVFPKPIHYNNCIMADWGYSTK